MAGKALSYSWGRVSRRGLAATPLPDLSEGTAPAPEINCTVLPNKLMVSSVDLGGPLSRVTIAFKVGSRNEMPHNLGVSHVIRSMAGFSTRSCTGFAIVRNIQQNGVHFTCTGDREVTSFNIVTARSNIIPSLKYLAAVACYPAFKPWQVLDNVPRLKYEIGCLTPQAKLIDSLHKVCFRKGLGNSLFVDPEYIGMHTPGMLHTFHQEGFTANRGSVAGYNIDHKEMVEFSKSLELVSCEPAECESKYYGGEIRTSKNSYFAHIALATQGVGVNNLKGSLVHAVLQHAYGVHPSIIWGGSPSPLYRATHPVAPDAGVSCFNVSYSDNGIFGVLVSSSARTAGKAIEEAFKVLKCGSVSENDVQRGKTMLKMNLLSSSENTENLIDDMVVQSLNGGVIIPPQVLAEAIDKITLSDVLEAARNIASQKFSLVALGDLTDVPYLDELC